MNPRQVWQAALGELQGSLTQATFEVWLKNTVAVDGPLVDGRFTIAAPTTFAKEWLDTRYRRDIEPALARILGRETKLDVVVAALSASPPTAAATRARRRASEPAQAPLPAAPTASPPPSPSSGVRRRRRSAPAEPSQTADPGSNGHHKTPIDDRWTFASFIVGPSNRFAFAAAQAVADEPATVYNPLFIHGGVGLGKTHLLQAVAQETAARGLKTRYVTCEQFTNDLIDAIQRRATDAFRATYRSNDVLLVDDIQFLAGKDATQDEFFHTFNDLHNARRQVVISSDRPPRAIATLEQRLTSRFEWGLIVDIQPPDLETRMAILRTRAQHQPLVVPDDVISLLAQRVQRNVRELEGSLTTVVAYAKIHDLPLSPETAARALAEVTAGRARPPQPADVVAAVAAHFKLDPRLLRGKQRDRDVVLPRHIAMFLMREETSASLMEIGRELGGRDHSTVLHGWDKIKRDVETDDPLRRDVVAVKERMLAEGY